MVGWEREGASACVRVWLRVWLRVRLCVGVCVCVCVMWRKERQVCRWRCLRDSGERDVQKVVQVSAMNAKGDHGAREGGLG
jgi:hypothetical protein